MLSITTCRRTSALYPGHVSTRGHGFRRRTPRPEHLTRSFGKDAVEGFLDVAKLVSSSGSSGRTAFEELADRIGRDVYIDVNGWHLYLRDVKATPGFSMAQVLAQSLGPQLVSRGYSEADVEQLLRKVPVKLGAGKINVALMDVLPAMCVSDLMRACEEYRD